MLRSVALIAVLCPTLGAQGGAPTFVPKPHLARLVAEDVPQLLARLPETAVGKLLRDPEVAEAFATGLARYRANTAQRSALVAAALQLDLALPPWRRDSAPELAALEAIRTIDLADLRRAELLAVQPTGESTVPTTVVTVACVPRAQGRWSAVFQRHVDALAKSPSWQADPAAKFAGFPAFVFGPAGNAATAQPEVQGDFGPPTFWLLQLPGVFAFGGGTPEACGDLAPAPERPAAQVAGEMDLQAFVQMFDGMGAAPAEFRALGLDTLRRLRWSARFVGPHVLDEIEVELAGEPQGLVGALLAGKAALPAQPLPDGALAQLRCAIELPVLLATAGPLGLADLPPEWTGRVTAALTGGVALGVAAPAPGSLVPRLYLSLGIADEQALQQLLDALFPGDTGKRHTTYEGVPCTVLTLPGLPKGLQPTFCRLDGVLHVAESAPSLRAFLKARARGGEAMDVGDTPLPAGPGDVLPTFDVRCDEQALYRTYHEVWLPLLHMVAIKPFTPLLTAQDMPEPDAVVPLLGRSRGVLRRDGATFRLQQQGPLGGVELAALAMAWGPLVSGVFHRDFTTVELAATLAAHRLQALWPAFEAFRGQHQRWPHDLAELVVAQKLPADALLVPGDPLAEVVPMPAGDPRVVKSSFRYFKEPVEVQAQGEGKRMLLIGIAPGMWQRPMLADDGALPQVWGEDATRPIDGFGK